MKPAHEPSISLVIETGMFFECSVLSSVVVYSLVCHVQLEFVITSTCWWMLESVLTFKADLLMTHFDSKQSREAVDLPRTCHPSPSLTTFAFRWREVRHLLLDFYPYGGTD